MNREKKFVKTPAGADRIPEQSALKRRVAGLFRLVLFLGLFACLYHKAQEILKLDMGHRGTDNVTGFYAEKEDSIEVLFIGASTMFCTADPLVLYEEYGIASYDFGSSAQPFALSYLFMQEAFRTQKPKVVALEMLSVGNELDTAKADNLNYGLTDMPFSLTKARGIYDMFQDDKGTGLSYLLPMMQYKDRWQELTEEDFTDGRTGQGYPIRNYAKGAYTPDLVAPSALDFSSYYEAQEFAIPERNLEIFAQMVALCEENDARLLLFKSPNVGWNISQTRAVQALAQEYNLPFLDFFSLMEELEIDPARDFRDNTHFNRYGSRKASCYLGEYLKAHYDLTDYRMTDSDNSWDLALQGREHDRANERVAKAGGLPDYMALIPYAGHTVVFSVTGDCGQMADFLRQLAGAFGLDAEKLLAGGSFAVRDGQCISGLIGTDDKPWRWECGSDTMLLTGYSITYDRDIYQLVDDGLTILVYDNEWEELVDVAGFDAYDPAHAIRSE